MMGKDVQIGVGIPLELKEHLVRWAKRSGVSVSE